MREPETFWMPHFLYGYQRAISDLDRLLDKAFCDMMFLEDAMENYRRFQGNLGDWGLSKEGASARAGYYCMLAEVYDRLEKGQTAFSACEQARRRYQEYYETLKQTIEPVEVVCSYGN